MSNIIKWCITWQCRKLTENFEMRFSWAYLHILQIHVITKVVKISECPFNWNSNKSDVFHDDISITTLAWELLHSKFLLEIQGLPVLHPLAFSVAWQSIIATLGSSPCNTASKLTNRVTDLSACCCLSHEYLMWQSLTCTVEKRCL